MPTPSDYDNELCALVIDHAPRLFAVIQEYRHPSGEPDAEIAAWGLAHSDGRTEVMNIDGGGRFSLNSPERAIWWFGREAGLTARLVWVRPSGAVLDPAPPG
jgi:hypothetical protein